MQKVILSIDSNYEGFDKKEHYKNINLKYGFIYPHYDTSSDLVIESMIRKVNYMKGLKEDDQKICFIRSDKCIDYNKAIQLYDKLNTMYSNNNIYLLYFGAKFINYSEINDKNIKVIISPLLFNSKELFHRKNIIYHIRSHISAYINSIKD